MKTWNPSPHPISDVRDWKTAGRLEVRPDFQRREVWSQAARVMLMDTILRDIPMPKMFLWNEIIGGSTHRRVIDGQQRINAILDFLDDKFALEPPYSGEFANKFFSELPLTVQQRFLHYRIDFNEAVGFTEDEVREVYSRVNKYSLPLNKQELRQADYPGEFLRLSEHLALHDYFDDQRVLTTAHRRRMGDVEFVSELLAGMLEGPQDKKTDLDYFYIRYAEWPEDGRREVESAFLGVIADLKLLFPDDRFPLRKTRFRQKADFYTIFLSVHECRKAGWSLQGKELGPVRNDLRVLDEHIAPTSEVDLLSEYAIKCVSTANSQASRAWRKRFLMNVLEGTYVPRRPSELARRQMTDILIQLKGAGQASLFDRCSGCEATLSLLDTDSLNLHWPESAGVYQMSNALWRCPSCHSDPR